MRRFFIVTSRKFCAITYHSNARHSVQHCNNLYPASHYDCLFIQSLVTMIEQLCGDKRLISAATFKKKEYHALSNEYFKWYSSCWSTTSAFYYIFLNAIWQPSSSTFKVAPSSSLRPWTNVSCDKIRNIVVQYIINWKTMHKNRLLSKKFFFRIM